MSEVRVRSVATAVEIREKAVPQIVAMVENNHLSRALAAKATGAALGFRTSPE